MIEKFEKCDIISTEKLEEYLEFCKTNDSVEGIRESHHILPQELFPEYSNLNTNKWNKSSLTIINHIKAHILLCEAIESTEMMYARNMMVNTRELSSLDNHSFLVLEKAKLESRKMQSKLMTENNPMKNPETAAKTSKNLKKFYENGGVNAMKGRNITEEHKSIISEANKGKIVKDKSKSDLNGYILRYGEVEGTKQYKENNKKKSVTLENQIEKYGEIEGSKRWENILKKKSENASGKNNSFYGKTHSDEMKKILSEKAKNREKLECPHCLKKATPAMAKRWHFDNCKFK